MATIKEEAQAYEPPQTKNICELEKVPVEVEVSLEQFTDKDGNPFAVKVVEIDGEKYRIPNSVLKSLKAILKKMPDLKHFSVLKEGEGLKTSYQVLPVNG